MVRTLDSQLKGSWFDSRPFRFQVKTLGKLFTHMQYESVPVKQQWYPMAWKVTVGLASHWPCVTDFSGLSIYGFNGLWKGDEHHDYTPLRSMAPFTFYLTNQQRSTIEAKSKRQPHPGLILSSSTTGLLENGIAPFTMLVHNDDQARSTSFWTDTSLRQTLFPVRGPDSSPSFDANHNPNSNPDPNNPNLRTTLDALSISDRAILSGKRKITLTN